MTSHTHTKHMDEQTWWTNDTLTQVMHRSLSPSLPKHTVCHRLSLLLFLSLSQDVFGTRHAPVSRCHIKVCNILDQ